MADRTEKVQIFGVIGKDQLERVHPKGRFQNLHFRFRSTDLAKECMPIRTKGNAVLAEINSLPFHDLSFLFVLFLNVTPAIGFN